jgi:Putative GTPase activating protein for Arf
MARSSSRSIASSEEEEGEEEVVSSRLKAVLQQSGNGHCADCSSHHPHWASFLNTSTSGQQLRDRYLLGVLLCDNCALYHVNVLGEKRCQIKHLSATHRHEWDMTDIEVLELTGNRRLNKILEATLTKGRGGFDKKLVVPDRHEEEERRSKFIQDKYRSHKYTDQIQYHTLVLQVLRQLEGQQQTQAQTQKATQPQISEPIADLQPPQKIQSFIETSNSSLTRNLALQEQEQKHPTSILKVSSMACAPRLISPMTASISSQLPLVLRNQTSLLFKIQTSSTVVRKVYALSNDDDDNKNSSQKNFDWGHPKDKNKNKLKLMADDFVRSTIVAALQEQQQQQKL